MKRIFANLLLFVTTAVLATPSIIPQPSQLKMGNGKLVVGKKVRCRSNDANLKKITEKMFRGYGSKTVEATLPVTIKVTGKGVAEGYQLSIRNKSITIEGTDTAGAFYGVQTLKQLLMTTEGGQLPLLTIKDSPRFGWRGYMLDESRHFFGKKTVKQLLDFMALYKLNRFHWHLTDSDGWRIEIKKYPKLTTIGAIGDRSDKKAPAQFYTQEDIKEIVQYAKERHIVIIPEIDMPGHATAAAKAYPEISGGGNSRHPDFTFNPGSEKTYEFLTNVLNEVNELFPAEWIHYGGDEVHFANKQWAKIPEVQALMKKEKLKNLTDVERYFNRRMAKVISGYGKKTAAWDEVVNAGLNPQETVVFWWRHDRRNTLADAFKKKFEVVLCPRIPCYLDFVQDDSHKVGRRWGGFSSLDKLYAFPKGLKIAESQVKGVQGNLWTEKVKSKKRFDFMTYPRLQALAASGWESENVKDYARFQKDLKKHLPFMAEKEIYYFNPFNKSEHPEPKK